MALATSHTGASRTTARGRPRNARRFRLNTLTPYVFVAPFTILFLLFFIAPICYTVYLSFFTEKRSSAALDADTLVVFNGIAHYQAVLRDPVFLDGVKRVLLFGSVQIPVMFSLALILALLMDTARIRFRSFFRLAAFLPYAVPGVVAVIMWGFLYTPLLSPFVKALNAAHIGSADPFLSPSTVLYSIANISTWEYTGYNMIIIYSALQAIPQQIYEAARIDGASELQLATRIKLPLVVPALVLSTLFSLIGTFQLFNEPQILRPLSNAIGSTFSPNMYAFASAFNNQNPYYAGAISVVLALVTFVLSFGFIRLSQRQA